MSGLPPGFELDQPSAAPALPPGFVVDQPSVMADVAKQGGIGLAKAGIGLMGLPGDISGAIDSVSDWTAKKLGMDPAEVARQRAAFDKFDFLPTSQGIQNKIEGVTGKFPEPQTTAGKYAQTIGEFAPAAFGGEGTLLARGLRAAVPGAASEAAGQATEGTAAEPYARFAGALGPGMAKSVANVAGGGLAGVGGVLTGTGASPLKTAFASGTEGGAAGQAFRENMRGSVPLDSVVADAKTALGNMRQDKNAAYQSGMKGVNADNTVLDFTDIDKAMARTNDVKSFKGQELSSSTKEVRDAISDAVTEWEALDPAEYHTAAGLDALKQKIGDIKESLPFNTPQRLVADQAYNAIRNTIVKQAPEYANTMKAYENASNQIGEIQKTLSLGRNASTDTALRKLQSVTRDNVNTNYGKRVDLAEALAQNGAPNLMESLGGQALSAWAPRGLAQLGTHAALTVGAGLAHPGLLATLPLQSPRIMGEVLHAAGRAAGGVGSIAPSPSLSTSQARLLAGMMGLISAQNQPSGLPLPYQIQRPAQQIGR